MVSEDKSASERSVVVDKCRERPLDRFIIREGWLLYLWAYKRNQKRATRELAKARQRERKQR